MEFSGRLEVGDGECAPPAVAGLVHRGPRAIATLLIGRLSHGKGPDNLCRIRNVSTGGMLIESGTTLSIGMSVTVELRSGEKLSGAVVWIGSGQAGVRFPEPVDLGAILHQLNPGTQLRSAPRRRPIRFEAQCAARVTSLGRTSNVKIDNLSQSGVRLQLPSNTRLENPLTLLIPGLSPLPAVVRWRIGDEAGLAFLDVIPFTDLSAWLAQRRD